MSVTDDELREWARHTYPLEAAVELLIRAFGGRFASSGYPWIRTDESGRPYVDAAQMTSDELTALSSSEAALLRIVASLLEGSPVNLGDSLPRLDRTCLDLTLAAVAHAAGSHDHSGLASRTDGSPSHFTRLATLHPWP